MRADEILKTGFAIAGESYADYPNKNLALSWLNVIISECTPAQKAIEERAGITESSEDYTVTSVYETVSMDKNLCMRCIPYGIASLVMADREKEYLSSVYRNRLCENIMGAAGGTEIQIADIYRGDE